MHLEDETGWVSLQGRWTRVILMGTIKEILHRNGTLRWAAANWHLTGCVSHFSWAQAVLSVGRGGG